MKNTVTRTDGTRSNNRAKVTNIEVSENYTTSKENGYEVIKIGSSSKTVRGRHSYAIKYTYDIGKDPLKNADELYYNLIGTEWDTTIGNVSFRITMPKAFDSSLLGFASGYKGATNSSNVSYQVNGQVIIGMVNHALNEGEGVTVRLTLPEGYFIRGNSNTGIYSIIAILFSIGCVIVAAILWAKFGKDDEVIETVEFYPPEGYNSAEIGFLYKGYVDTPDVISLLIYLANEGYLKIEETEEQGIFKKSKGFKITKIKEYDRSNENERMFFDGLFGCARGTILKTSDLIRKNKELSWEEAKETVESLEDNTVSVTKDDLYDCFYVTLDRIKRNLNRKKNKNVIFESSASGKRIWLILMIVVIFLLITIKPVVEYSEIENLIFALLFPGIGFTVLFTMLFGKGPIIVKIFGVFWGTIFGGVPWMLMVLPALQENMMYFTTYVIGIVCVAAISFFIKIMPKRTPYGNEVLGKLRGFKRFLETAEKPELEKLVTQNPEYFYHILPYTYALGVSDVWINQFETIALQAPNWYDSTDHFNMHTFGTFMTTTMTSASRAMSSRPSDSGDGGSSSGGGSSGGGSGGGGGGSW